MMSAIRELFRVCTEHKYSRDFIRREAALAVVQAWGAYASPAEVNRLSAEHDRTKGTVDLLEHWEHAAAWAERRTEERLAQRLLEEGREANKFEVDDRKTRDVVRSMVRRELEVMRDAALEDYAKAIIDYVLGPDERTTPTTEAPEPITTEAAQ